ncbi:MAG: DUF4340 domain-containing protein [Opitutaceae bacterium]|nr:DUF4340 domain-containing protein [Opitutaceae bacterium]
MRTKVTLVLIFLNAALFIFIFKFERPWRRDAEAKETKRRVLGPEASDIRSIEVTSSVSGGSFALERRRDTWFLTQPFEWPANLHAASALVHDLQLLEHESAFPVADLGKSGLSLADYGIDLEKPKLKVAFSSIDPASPASIARSTTVLLLGDTTKDGRRLYLLSPDRERVHVVKRSFADTLTTPLDQLRADTLLAVRVFEARSLTVQTAGNTNARVRIRRDGTRWRFETPLIAAASTTAMEVVIKELNGLRAKSFPATPPATLPSSSPTMRVTLEGNGVTETLFIGDPVPAAGTAPAAATAEYYGQLESRTAVFTVAIPVELFRALGNAHETLRERRILDFDPAQVTAVALSSPAQPRQPPITLQRLEPPAGQTAGAAPAWQIVVRSDGTQGPQTLPAERAAVLRLLDRLSLLTAEKFQSDEPKAADLEDWGFNRPLREVTITLAGAAAPLVLRLGTDASRTTLFARAGTPGDPGNSIVQVRPEIERDLDLSPLAWRDRAVSDPLPASARIAAVKITEIDSKRVLFESPVEAGQPPSAALATVVTALRALRAKDFLPGGFTEKITAAGDDRPWRLLLETTIALPGPAGAELLAVRPLHLSERLGGALQYAGSKELDVVFTLEQPLVDALWTLAYGARDPGPPPAPKQ